jgi:hypothetical protein
MAAGDRPGFSNCSTGCREGGHATYGECLRAKSTRIGYCQSGVGNDRTRQKKWDSRLQEYRRARKQGIQPDSTKLPDIRRAVDISNQTGVAYDASKR